MIEFIKGLLKLAINTTVEKGSEQVAKGLHEKASLQSPQKWRKQYIENHLSDTAFEDEVARRTNNGIYVMPRLVEESPYKTNAPQQTGTSLNDFFIGKLFRKGYAGNRVFCILADTGMGKTTAMVNLFCDYINQYKAETLPYEIRLLSFSDEKIFEKIEKITDKEHCILLLDAVDESTEAQNADTYPDFLKKLEATYAQFARVITTCRPQFFGENKGEFDETNVKRGSYFIKCQKLYLDYFNNDQIQEYLDQKPTFSPNSPERTKAENIIAKCPDIAMRPLVLNYIDILVANNTKYTTTRKIYDIIVEELIAREVAKIPSNNRAKLRKQWLELSSEMAGFMYRSHPLSDTITEAEIAEVVTKYNESLPDKEKVDVQTFRDRSLLTRDGEERRFSHKSFYEFLMAYRFFLNYDEIKSLQGMDFAVQIFDELCADYREGHGDGLMPIQQVSEADAAHAMGTIGLKLSDLNQFNGAAKEYSAALETFRRLASDDPAYKPYVATVLNNLAALHNDTNNYAQAAEEYAEALVIYRRLAEANPAAYEPDVAMTLNNFATLHCNTNDYAQAAKEYDEALVIYRRLAADPAYEPDVAMTLNNLAALHDDMNDYDKAAEEYTEALVIYRRLAEANPAAYEPDVAMTLNNLAVLHKNMNDYAQAAEEYDEALEICRRLAEANPAAYEPYVAKTLNNLAVLHNDMNDYAQAAEEYDEALVIRRRLAEATPAAYEPYVAATLNNLAVLHENMNDYAQAAEEYAEALEIYRRLAEANPAAYEPYVAMTLFNLALLHKAQGNYSEAEVYAQESLDIYRRFAEISHAAFDGDVKDAEGLLSRIREAIENDD
ncbi:MAG: tetratricopeptide repeat protein [Bacteroidales bacterium]|nr:tetratricopeptide repeat protein [Bacteroidales bacterium]